MPFKDEANTINGSAPHETSLDSTGIGFSPLSFDAREFMQFIENERLTEAEAEQLLRAIWDIAVAFVDIAYGIHPVQQVLVDRLPEPSKPLNGDSPAVLSSRNAFSKTANHKTAERDLHERAAKEDS